MNIGILGCGAIGRGIARYIVQNPEGSWRLTGVYDIDQQRAGKLAVELSQSNLKKASLTELIQDCDLMVEAINAPDTRDIIEEALSSRKHVLALSAGKLLDAGHLFELAARNRCQILIPSGAISGIDAVKSGALTPVKQITLTTRKPVSGFQGVSYIQEKGIDLEAIKEETVIFEGGVADAVKHFPQNINVAATLALACGAPSKLTIRIITSPEYTFNSHEIEMTGDFGRLVTKTENRVSPENPKTSYLAVLSALRTLKDFCEGKRIGT